MNPSENLDQKFSLLIYNYLLGIISFEEKKELLDWLRESDDNKKIFAEYRKIFYLSASVNHKGNFRSQKSSAFKRLKSKMETLENRNNSLMIKRISYYSKIAAIIILIFSIGAFTSLWLFKTNSDQKLSNIEYEVNVPRGGKTELVLPDGTKVWLNADSHFRYRGDYGSGSRNVYLEGEGYFSVVKNPEKPFVVSTSGIDVKAFGTVFNVKAYPEEKYVTTTLVEGVVKIEGKGLNVSLKPKDVVILQKQTSEIVKADGEKETLLTKDEIITRSKTDNGKENILFSKDVQMKSGVNTNIYTSWKDNLWIIRSESLKNIASVLERKFDVIIQIKSPELDQYTFTGTFNKETLEQILNILKLTAPLKYEIGEGVVIIEGVQKRKSIYDNFQK